MEGWKAQMIPILLLLLLDHSEAPNPVDKIKKGEDHDSSQGEAPAYPKENARKDVAKRVNRNLVRVYDEYLELYVTKMASNMRHGVLQNESRMIPDKQLSFNYGGYVDVVFGNYTVQYEIGDTGVFMSVQGAEFTASYYQFQWCAQVTLTGKKSVSGIVCLVHPPTTKLVFTTTVLKHESQQKELVQSDHILDFSVHIGCNTLDVVERMRLALFEPLQETLFGTIGNCHRLAAKHIDRLVQLRPKGKISVYVLSQVFNIVEIKQEGFRCCREDKAKERK